MENEIDVKQAKCRKLSLDAPICFAKQGEEPDISRFDIDAYTGSIVSRWWGKLAIDVSGIKAKQKMPILLNHDTSKIVGFSTSSYSDNTFRVSGVFSKSTESAGEVKALAAEGFPWQASIGVMPSKIVEVKRGDTMSVNGIDIDGPAEVWTESEVFETSFVPLGADGNTSVSVFSHFDEVAEESHATMRGSNMDIETLKKDHPDLVTAITKEAEAGMEEKLRLAHEEGGKAENARIKDVLAQSLSGHEALIESMAFDGKTTGPEAAVAVLQAERGVRKEVLTNLQNGAPHVVQQSSTDAHDNRTEDENSRPNGTRARNSGPNL